MKVQQYFMMIIIHVINRKISKVIKCKSDFPFSGANYVTPEKEKDIVSIQLGYAIYFLNTHTSPNLITESMALSVLARLTFRGRNKMPRAHDK